MRVLYRANSSAMPVLVHETLAITIILLTRWYLVSASSKIHFSFIVSCGEFGFNSSGAIPAVDIALDYVKRNQILPNYTLTYERIGDSKVSNLATCIHYL